MVLRSLSALAFLIVFLSPVRGLDKDSMVERAPAHDLVPFVYDPGSLKKVPVACLTDYPAYYIHASTSYRIEADGAIESTTHEVIRLNNRKGIDQIGEHRNVTYCPSYEKLVLNEARVLKPDGRRVAVEPKNLQLRDVPNRITWFTIRAKNSSSRSLAWKPATSSIVEWTTR